VCVCVHVTIVLYFHEAILPGPSYFAPLCYSVLQCVTVCCSVLQCIAVYYSALQCVAVCCSVLQYVAVCCSVMQCVSPRRPTALGYPRDTTHSYAWHDSFICMTWLILMRDMTNLFTWHASRCGLYGLERTSSHFATSWQLRTWGLCVGSVYRSVYRAF